MDDYELKKVREQRAALDGFEICAPLNKKGKVKKNKRLTFIEIPDGMEYKCLEIVKTFDGKIININDAVIIYMGDEERIVSYHEAWYNDYSECFEYFETPKVPFFNGENNEGYTTEWQTKVHNMVYSDYHNAYIDKNFAVVYDGAILHSSEVTKSKNNQKIEIIENSMENKGTTKQIAVTKENFFLKSNATWEIQAVRFNAEKKFVELSKKYGLNYKSISGSAYVVTTKGVYRLSNHWGNVATCSWNLKEKPPKWVIINRAPILAYVPFSKMVSRLKKIPHIVVEFHDVPVKRTREITLSTVVNSYDDKYHNYIKKLPGYKVLGEKIILE